MAARALEVTQSIDAGEVNNRHKVYYFPDGVIFLVEHVLFKVPRHMLESQSPFFKTLFSLPTGPGEEEGSTDARPINIRQVMSVDFERLLALLYPLTLQYTTFTENWEIAEWVSILHLATMWEMAEARSVAIKNISGFLTPIGKVVCGRQYDCPMWVKEGFTDLCLRSTYLSMEEACQLNTEDLVKYGKVRENIRVRLMKPLYRNVEGVRTKFRGDYTYARTAGYEQGQIYHYYPLVEELIEDHFLEKCVEE